MKAVVTGGGGFIGSNIVRQLLVEGWDVTVVDDFSTGYERNLERAPQATLLRGDIRDEALMDRALDGARVVFHLAASVGNKASIDHPFRDADINVRGTLVVLEAMRKRRVGKIVYSSSAGIFGELKTLPIREDHPIEPLSPYGATKLAGEKLVLAYGGLYGFESVALRYFNVYGPHQRFDAYGNVIPIFAHRMLSGEPITIFGDGEQTRDFVNVNDVAQANIRSGTTAGVTGAFNVGSATRISINDLAGMMYRILGIEPQIRYGEPRPGDVRDSLADVSRAQRAFGFDPAVELESGMREYLDWMRADMAHPAPRVAV